MSSKAATTAALAGSNRTNRVEYVNVAGYTFGLDRNRGPHQLRLGIDGQYSAVNSCCQPLQREHGCVVCAKRVILTATIP